MITCPNCGIENPPERIDCRVCRERLPREEAAPPPLALDVLLGDEPAPDPPEPEPAPDPEPAAEAEPAPDPPSPVGALPDWLSGTVIESGADTEREEALFDESLDYSELPDWPTGETRDEGESDSEAGGNGEPIFFETVGTGLLTGVRGPIPVEPVISLPHAVADIRPAEMEGSAGAAEEAALFGRVARGEIAPAPLRIERPDRRRIWPLTMILIVAVLVPLLLNWTLFGPPARLAATSGAADVVATLPEGGELLVAIEYEGALAGELEPGAVALLTLLRESGRLDSIVAVSTRPQGLALADRLWSASEGGQATWDNRVAGGFYSGETIGVRAILAERLGARGAWPVAVLVIGAEAGDIQRWIEQVGAQRPGLPILAVAPAAAEPILAPYVDSGQLSALVAGIAGAASLELYELERADGAGWRRIDAVTTGALVVLGAILAGNLTARRRGDHEVAG